mmetsp:Transcript_42341/g.135571  ORF Transcript_42341/g.135571 Transcript_42341/m.135571 type:complete len:353 (-) Transcript_42341:28-1086(-)
MAAALDRLAGGPSIMDRIMGNEAIKMTWACGGIIGCLMMYGVMQERVMTQPYGEEGAMFKYSLFLVMCNRLTTCSLAVIMLLMKGESMKPVAPVYTYAAVSLSNVVATTCQYEALKYITFPVQTLGKCAKMIPVMIWGTAIMRKKYTVRDYLIAVAVMAGCTLFLTGGEVKSKRASLQSSDMMMFYGLLLMIGYLGFDGFTSTFQDKLFKGYSMSMYNQILYVTACSSILSVGGLMSAGQFGPAMEFISKYPECVGSVMMLSLAATIGQLFISFTIRTYGALLFATVMTTRQFFSILLSAFMFMHPITLQQWAAVAVVFGATYVRAKSHAKQRGSKVRDTERGSSPDKHSKE